MAYKVQKFGDYSTRRSFSKSKNTLELSDLLEIQKKSYQDFLEVGIKDVFEEIFPIESFTGNVTIDFSDYSLDTPRYTIKEAKERMVNYAAPLKVKARVFIHETGEVKEQEIFLGDMPLMTDAGTFIINGAERVIISQLVRSPSVYFKRETDKSGRRITTGEMIPNKGTWLEFETDAKGVVYIRIDRTRKLPITTFLRSLGLGTNEEITSLFGEYPDFDITFEKDSTSNTDEALIEIYEKLRPGEPATLESAKNHLMTRFFDHLRYDLAKVGRYKFNKKLNVAERLLGLTLAEDIKNKDNKVIFEKGHVVEKQDLPLIREALKDGFGLKKVPILEELDSYDKVQIVKVISPEDGKTIIPVIGNDGSIDEKRLTISDVYASTDYYLNLLHGIGNTDEIDNLGNRRVRQVGELIENQFRTGMQRMERVIRERMTTQETEDITPKSLINIRPVTAVLKEFFGSSQLSKFMDQVNPLAELTDKRRLSSIGPGGLSRERASMDVRDVNPSHYGRICPIESPEGQNIGLMTSLAGYAKVNEFGFLMTPYRKVNNGIVDMSEVIYLTADEEEEFNIAGANVELNDNYEIEQDQVFVRYMGDNKMVKKSEVDYVDVSPSQLVSITTSCIPFLNHDDGHRALMGSNMQRQAVPLLKTEAPIVGTGVEATAAKYSGSTIVCKGDGVVEYADALKIVVKTVKGKDTYLLQNFEGNNADNCSNHVPIVHIGDKVKAGQVIADGPSTDKGELALGKNLVVAFTTYNGFNYEDAVVINKKLVKDDVFTSLHIKTYDIDCRDTKLGPEEFTRDIPNVSEEARKNLDAQGIVRIGTEVHDGDILVGKVTPKGVQELTSEEKLLHAIFGEKTREVRDTSLRVEHGAGGIVHDIKVYTKENSDELAAGVFKKIRVYIIQKRKIQVGDKLCGRHGNKGVISLVLPEEDMPYLPDGRPVDILMNPLGVPSRMNIGQILESHLGIAGYKLGVKYATPVFDGANIDDIHEELAEAGLPLDGKVTLTDGRTGEPYEQKINVGVMYIVKLNHMVDDKLHARATGPYSMVTQQPLGGKAQFGGQRFGEMEVWALYAYGASHVLQEILTIKSDDVVGRVKVFESLVKGKTVNAAGIPESFRVLIKELQALGLNVQIVDDKEKIVDLKDLEEDDSDDDNLQFKQIEITDDDIKKDNKELDDLDKEIEEDDSFLDDEVEEPSLDDIDYPGDEEAMELGDEE